MESLYDAIKLFPFPTTYPCRACNKGNHKPHKFFKHLEECLDAKMNPGLKRLMTYEAKWQEIYIRFRNTHVLVSRGGIPFDDEDCEGCQSYEEHKEGICRTKRTRVETYNAAITPLIDELLVFYENFLQESDALQLAEANAHYDHLWTLQLEEKTQVEESIAATKDQRKISRHLAHLEKINKCCEIQKKCRQYRIKAEKLLQLPTQKVYNTFVTLIKKMQEEDLAHHRDYDNRLILIDNLLRPDREPFNTMLNNQIINARVTKNVGEEMVRREMSTPRVFPVVDEDYPVRRRVIRESQQAIEALERFNISPVPIVRRDPNRVTHQDRLGYLRKCGALADNAIFAANQDYRGNARHYNNATGWYHATIEHHDTTTRRVIEEMLDALRAGLCVEFYRLMMEYVKTRRLLNFALGFTEAATRALSSLHGYQQELNDPTDAHKRIKLNSRELSDRFRAHNKQVYSVAYGETCKTQEAIREIIKSMKGSTIYPNATNFLQILQRIINEDYERSLEKNNTPARRFTTMVYTYGSFNFDRPQPGAHMEELARALDRELFGDGFIMPEGFNL